jgi:hypothetical protein
MKFRAEDEREVRDFRRRLIDDEYAARPDRSSLSGF